MGSLSNTAEGTSGSNIPTTNAGGPDAFNTTAVTGTGTTATWDNTHVYQGSTSLRDHMAAVSSTIQQSWSTLPSTPTANAYVRFYLFLTAYPSFSVGTTAGICRFLGAAALRAGVVLQPTGELRTINSAGGTISTTTEQVPLNQWVRVEFELTGISGTTGTVACRIFSGANLETTSPDSGGSVSASNGSIGGTVDTARFGPQSAITLTTAWDSWWDSFAYSDVATPGPSVTSVTWTPQRYGQPAPPSLAPWAQKDLRDANTVATDANPLAAPLDSAWQADAPYWHLYGDSALRDRRQYFQQRTLVPDPSMLTGPAVLDPVLSAWASLQAAYEAPAMCAPRTWQPQQRPYISDPLLLTTAELENELLGGADAARRGLAAAYTDRREVPQQRPYVSDPLFYPVQAEVGAGTTEAWWGADTDSFYRVQRLLVSDPSLLAPAGPLDVTTGGQDDLGRRWRQAATHCDRRLVPQQRAYISDPSFYPAVAPTDPLTVAWGAGGNCWHLYNRADDITDRRAYPYQRAYISSPLLLTTALLENGLLGGAGTAGRYLLPATHTDRRQAGQQRLYPAGVDIPLDPVLAAWADQLRRVLLAATHADRRLYPQQRLYFPLPAPPPPFTVGILTAADGAVLTAAGASSALTATVLAQAALTAATAPGNAIELFPVQAEDLGELSDEAGGQIGT